VDFILAGQPEPPLYFARMKRDNRRGPALLPVLPAPPRVEPAAVAGLQHRSDVVVLDTRQRQAYFGGHLTGSILAELDYQFCSIAGSYVNEDTPIYLLVDQSRLDEAVRALIRVGLDRIAGYLTPDMLAAFERGGGSLSRTEVIDMGQMEARRASGQGRVLDVRGGVEFEAGHVPDAIHVAHTRVPLHLDTLPRDTPLLVQCNSGARAAAVVSLLERHGLQAVEVNDLFANYHQPDLKVGTSA